MLVELEFVGVVDFRLIARSSPYQVAGFDVVDISDRQLEGRTFEAFDYEAGSIGFFCHSYRITAEKSVAFMYYPTSWYDLPS